MKTLPPNLTAYRRTPTFTEANVPKGLLADHTTKAGTWGVITVESGRLDYTITGTGETVILEPGTNGIVEPEELHHVTPVGAVAFYVEFWR
jgi:tellurite resistance-related uncharacterized protein